MKTGLTIWEALSDSVNEEKIDRLMRGNRMVFRASPDLPALQWMIADERTYDGSRIVMAWDISLTDELVQKRITFLMSASHELRSPLTALLGFAEVLQLQSDELTDSQALAATVIRQNAEHLQTMVDDIIDLSRNSFGELRLKTERLDVVKLIAEVSEALRPQIEARGQALVVRIKGVLEPIEADGSRIRQIIFNLVQNAHVHTPEGSRIEISASSSDEGVLIRVTDDGDGMPFDDPEKAFSSFQRGPATGAVPVPGSGIGLTISRQLVQLHRGTIEVESTPGEGAKFSVWLPVDREKARRLVTPDLG